ncbi:MAG TPA: hypothetical protein VFB22_07695 [Candidatus Baltobacteraceae bacterium]|nr:hypothetical protein [Candidatus Baltobacteraceae bacterium]
MKSAADISGKVRAKRNHPDEARRSASYSARDVTDASGFRIVCLFNRDIPNALE